MSDSHGVESTTRLEGLPASGTHFSGRVQFAFVLFGQIFLAATNWGVTVILARTGGAHAVGLYSNAVTISIPILALGSLNLKQILITDRSNQFRFPAFSALRAITSTICLAIVGVIAFCAGFTREASLIIVAYALTPFLDSNAEIFQAIPQKFEIMHFYGLSMVIRGLLNICFFTLTYFTTRDLAQSLLASALSSLLVLVAWDYFQASRLRFRYRLDVSILPSWNLGELFRLARASAPIGLAASLATINEYTTRALCIRYLDTAMVGIFSTINYIVNVGGQAATALGSTITPKLSRLHHVRDFKQFNVVLMKALSVNLVMGAAGLLFSAYFGHIFLDVVFGHEFSRYSAILTISMFAGLLYYVSLPFTSAVTAMRVFTPQVYVNTFVLLTAACVGFTLLPRFGIFGAAYTGVAVMGIRLVAWLILFLNSKVKLQRS